MNREESTHLSDERSLAKAKKDKSDAIMNAAFIGFVIGILVFSIAKNGLGFFTLIPLYFLYIAFKKRNVKTTEKLTEEQKLK